MGTVPVAHVDEGDVTMIVESIFAELLGLSVRPDEPGPGDGRLVGLVRIRGAWHGTVSITCDRDLATRIATVMLDRAPRDEAELADAIGEVANMAGGNVKALLPSPSVLSLPEVAGEGSPAVARDGRLVSRVAFAIDGSPIVVTVVEDAGDDRGA